MLPLGLAAKMEVPERTARLWSDLTGSDGKYI